MGADEELGAGLWAPPGRFRVLLNGRPLAVEFGTQEGWAWQDGGTVSLVAGDARIELQDLTGFDGRCDAIFLTRALDIRPPSEPAALRVWRDRMLGAPSEPPVETFDVAIVGGGIAGCAAALAAAEQGLQVALIHDRSVLGGNASGEVRVHTIGITGYSDRILRKINTRHWPNGSAEALADDRKRHAAMDAEARVRQFLGWRAYGVAMGGNRIVRVHARHTETSAIRAFEAPCFIDATGDGWIGYWAGALYRYGREPRDEFGEGWDLHGDLWSPAMPDRRMMGVSLLWNSRIGHAPSSFPDVPWAVAVSKDNVAVQGEWFWEYSTDRLDMIENAEEIRDHLLRAIYGSFANAKKQSRYAVLELDFVGYIAGKRESRRLVGDYIYTLADMVEGRMFPDAVATEIRDVDLHYQRIVKDPSYPYDYLSTALFKNVPRYFIPFHSLYSTNIVNLMMAGRCFSCSHVGLGGPRVMNTCGQMGAATGYAAALIKKHGTTPRGVYQHHLAELIALVRPPLQAENLAHPERWVERTVEVVAAAMPAERVRGGFGIAELPAPLRTAVRVVPDRGDSGQPGRAYRLTVNADVDVYIAVHARDEIRLPAEWKKTDRVVVWKLGRDPVYHLKWAAGAVEIPPHNGREGSYFGLPHLAFVVPAGPIPDGGLTVSDAQFEE